MASLLRPLVTASRDSSLDTRSDRRRKNSSSRFKKVNTAVARERPRDDGEEDRGQQHIYRRGSGTKPLESTPHLDTSTKGDGRPAARELEGGRRRKEGSVAVHARRVIGVELDACGGKHVFDLQVESSRCQFAARVIAGETREKNAPRRGPASCACARRTGT